MPAWAVRLLFGQMGEELLLSGRRVEPQRLRDAGYRFRFERLEAALADLV
jgi:NAD dependent epimerase/dehydratase family enzyme